MFGVEITAGWIQEADARFLFWIYISRLIKTIDSKCSIISQKEVQLFPFPALKWLNWEKKKKKKKVRKEKGWQRQQRKMRGTQSGGACERRNPDETWSGGQQGNMWFHHLWVHSPPVYFYLHLRDVYSIWANKLARPFSFCRDQKTLPVMRAEIKHCSQICWCTLAGFDLQSGSLQSTICKIPPQYGL